jgi:hypothetical protein
MVVPYEAFVKIMARWQLKLTKDEQLIFAVYFPYFSSPNSYIMGKKMVENKGKEMEGRKCIPCLVAQ